MKELSNGSGCWYRRRVVLLVRNSKLWETNLEIQVELSFFRCLSRSTKLISSSYQSAGDIAFEASKSVRLLLRPSPLMCHSVYSTLLQISRLKG